MAKVLVVDDEERNLRLVEAILKPMGYEVAMANNGKKGIEMAVRENPDVILLDIMMPGMDGYEVAAAIRQDEATAIIPIVMVTALNDVQYRIRALEVGATDFLSKPFDKLELRARVDSLVKVKAYNDRMRDYQKDLEAEVARRTEELEQAYKAAKAAAIETIFKLVRAAEYKDSDTGNHVRRMSRYSAAIAQGIGLPPDHVEDVLYAAPMHDIGKIGIPDNVLLKEGKLSDEEWTIMRQHPMIGACIIENSDISFVDLGRVIALTHHERWDGTGYPQGLKGEEIPLEGRIVALADVFDALTTKRPYKEPFPFNVAVSIIGDSAGAHFDPEVVNVFMNVQEEIMAIRDRFGVM